MELLSTRRDVEAGRIRVTGTVAYDDRARSAEEYWFEFPSEHAGVVTESGNPWLACLAPLAAWLGEPLRIGLPVDALLVRNVREAMAIWKSWYPRAKIVPILALSGGPGPASRGDERTALFFSGGVDSQYSLYRNGQDEAGVVPIDDLIVIQGFDISLERRDAFERHVDRLGIVARATGKALIPAATNLRSTRLREAPWGELWHGCALAAVGLTLERCYRRLMIASANHYADLYPWGSHPMIDPLLSTARTLVLHDGATLRRWDKLELVSLQEAALQTLHVCYRDGTDANCGRCEKCLRNMIILELLGVLDRYTTFPARRLDLTSVSRLLLRRAWQPVYYGRLRRLAVSRKRPDVARAIQRALQRSRRLRPVLSLANRLSQTRGLGRLGRPLKRWAFAGSVR